MKGIKTDKTGETRTMNNGLQATIIEYFGCNDMTIRFENGEVREHISYGCFSNGEVKAFSLPNQKLNFYRLGEKRIMKDGFEAELIAYRSCHDCDVLLADGTIRKHVRYSRFTDGDLKIDIAKLRVGETRRMKNGLMATILAYHHSTNIDIQFEDGFIRKGVRYEAFANGSVAHPGLKRPPKERKERRKQSKKKPVQKEPVQKEPVQQKPAQVTETRLGERQQMSTGRWCTVSAYRNWRDMDVLFDDGELVEGVTYKKFSNKTIKTPKDKPTPIPLVGQTKRANNGLMMTIIAARGRLDIDVEFEDFNKILYKEDKATSADKMKMVKLLEKTKKRMERNYPARETRNEIVLTVNHFIRCYEFLLQASCFEDVALHKKYNFISYLSPYLKINHTGRGFDLKGKIEASGFFQRQGEVHTNQTMHSNPNVKLPTADQIVLTPQKTEKLSQIIAELNSRTGKNYDCDVAVKAMLQIRDIMMKSEDLKTSARNNPEEEFVEFSYYDAIDAALTDGLEQNLQFFTQLLNDEEMKKKVLGIFASEIYKSLKGDA